MWMAQIKWSGLACFFASFCFGIIGFLIWGDFTSAKYSALRIQAPSETSQEVLTGIGPSEPLTLSDVKNLLVSWDHEVESQGDGKFVSESETSPKGGSLNHSEVGFGRSSFLIRTNWGVFRYLGKDPAGAGKTGELLDLAQQAAFGTPRDSLPVTTMAFTVTQMMENFYKPLLEKLDFGQEALKKIYVNAAYYSPQYNEEMEIEEGRATHWNNAFAIGQQTLLVFPSSCLKSERRILGCNETQLTVGHDPMVVAHELGHLVFNNIADFSPPLGFQWSALNEALADYFSAAYFQTPFLGRIWRASAYGDPYLRNLNSALALGDKEAFDNFHRHSTIFSSGLWNLRKKLGTSNGDNSLPQKKAAEFDVVVLHSIRFAGLTHKTNLADGVMALLRSAEMLGRSEWKDEIRAEFQNRGVNLKENSKFLSPAAQFQGDASCGVVGNQGSFGFTFTLLLLPLVILLFSFGCTTRGKANSQKTEELSGKVLSFSCSYDYLTGKSTEDFSKSAPKQVVTFHFMNQGKNTPVQKIRVSDQRFLENTDAIWVQWISQNQIIDSVYNTNWEPISFNDLKPTQLPYFSAARLFLEQVPKIQNESFGTEKMSPLGAETGLAVPEGAWLTSLSGVGPIAKKVTYNDTTICELIGKE
jgi:hypothetical protein